MSASLGFGTVAWAQAGNGALTAGERVREIAKGAFVVLRTAPAQLRQRVGLPNPRAFAYDVDHLPVPDSAIARQAEEFCRDACPAAQRRGRSAAWSPMWLAPVPGACTSTRI